MFGLGKLFTRGKNKSALTRKNPSFVINEALRDTLANLRCDVFYGGCKTGRNFRLYNGFAVRVVVGEDRASCFFIFIAPNQAMGSIEIADIHTSKEAVFFRNIKDENDPSADVFLMNRCIHALNEFIVKDMLARSKGLDGFAIGDHRDMSHPINRPVIKAVGDANGGKGHTKGMAKSIAQIVATSDGEAVKASAPKGRATLRLVVDNTAH